MKVTVFGTKKWELKDERTGEFRRGITAHCTSDSLSPNVRGLEYSKFSVDINSPMYSVVEQIELPANLDLTFNRYGKVQDFEVL